MNKSYAIEGLACAGCANTVKQKFSQIDGVESVEVDIQTKHATVSGNYDEQALKDSLSDTKYSVKES